MSAGCSIANAAAPALRWGARRSDPELGDGNHAACAVTSAAATSRTSSVGSILEPELARRTKRLGRAMWMWDGSSLATSTSMPRAAEVMDQTFFSVMCGESFPFRLKVLGMWPLGPGRRYTETELPPLREQYNWRNLRLCK